MPPITKLAMILLALASCDPGNANVEDESESEEPLDGECGDLTCSSGLHVSLVAQGRTFTAGTYTVAFELGDARRSCGFMLAAGPDACGGESHCMMQSDCDATFNLLVLPHTIGFSVPTLAEYVDVQIRRDDRAIVTTGFAPMYDIYFPNGSDCEPACSLAQVEVAVP